MLKRNYKKIFTYNEDDYSNGVIEDENKAMFFFERSNFLSRFIFKNICFSKTIGEMRFINCCIINCRFKYTPNRILSFNECYLEATNININAERDADNFLMISGSKVKDTIISDCGVKDIIIDNCKTWGLCFERNVVINEMKIRWVNTLKMKINGNVINKLELRKIIEVDKTEFSGNEYSHFVCPGYEHLKRKFEDRAYIAAYKKENPKKAFLWRVTSNYGESFFIFLLNAFVVFIVLNLLFGIVYKCNPHFFFTCEDWVNWFQPFYFSIVKISSLGFVDINPITEWGKSLVLLEGIIGWVFLGIITIYSSKIIGKS